MGKHTQGIAEPIIVKERPKYLGPGYGKHGGESSKDKEAHEGVPRRTSISCSLPQAFEDCVNQEFKSFIPTLKEGAHKHVANENDEQEYDESSKVFECIVGIPKRTITSSNSPPQEGNKGECSRYKSDFYQVAFDYDKHR